VSDGGRFTETGLLVMIGHESGAGTITVAGAGSRASIDTVFLGNGGSGAIRVEKGGSFSTQSLFVGTTGYAEEQLAGKGTVLVEGPGSALTVGTALDIGGEYDSEREPDQGAVTIANGGTLLADPAAGSGQPGIVVGAEAYGSGVLKVTDPGSAVSVTGSMVVGYYGSGTLDVLNGAAVRIAGTPSAAGLVAGELENFGSSSRYPFISTGSILVSGSNSSLSVLSSAITIGLDGVGKLTIADGGSAASGALNGGPSAIGDGAGGSGTVLVTGSGSHWTNTGTLEIGYGAASPYGGTSDSGSLIVSAGGTVSLGALDIGGNGGTGSVTVTGYTSTLRDTGALVLGASGTGTMIVANDGDVTTHSLTVGDAAASGTGKLTLSGAGAALDVQGNAVLAAGSIGMAGGTLEVGGKLTLDSGQTLAGHGLVDTAAIINGATVEAQSGQLTFIGDVSGTGKLVIGSGATLSLSGVVGGGQTTTFSAGKGLLDLGDPAHFASHILGFGTSDQIDLDGVLTRSQSYSGQTLTLDAVDGRTINIGFAGAYTAANFAVASDGHGGSLISFKG
jgi:T5SS/PEP-CTERM-associated repeat protein